MICNHTGRNILSLSWFRAGNTEKKGQGLISYVLSKEKHKEFNKKRKSVRFWCEVQDRVKLGFKNVVLEHSRDKMFGYVEQIGEIEIGDCNTEGERITRREGKELKGLERGFIIKGQVSAEWMREEEEEGVGICQLEIRGGT